jgi:integrative and conjugative element protein (TIGR02256 family)
MHDLPELFVHEAVLGSLLRLPSRPWEVGGWLLGYWTEARCALVVTHATPPGGRGTPLGVTITAKGHQRRFDQAWARSAGLVTFLGDWHTHPGGPATPSHQDRKTMRQLADDPDYQTPQPLIAIIANPRWPRLPQQRHARFYLRYTNRRVHELDPIPTTQLAEAARNIPAWPWPHLGHHDHPHPGAVGLTTATASRASDCALEI